ncbi:hypothetical protein [Mariniflexile sp. HMF6888]|uniref:hypothetical protein n=1 Tax=Mariniflexile sp. HMF6888 TaxID=3373086 RepID=UPI00378E6FE3
MYQKKNKIQVDVNRTLFLDENSNWILEGVNGVYDLSKFNYSMYLLPLLKKEFNDFKNEVEKSTSLEDFPFIELIKFPFENKMLDWSILALKWIVDGKLEDIFENWAKTIDVGWMPQRFKHKFLKILKVRSYPGYPRSR